MYIALSSLVCCIVLYCIALPPALYCIISGVLSYCTALCGVVVLAIVLYCLVLSLYCVVWPWKILDWPVL